MLGLKFSVLGLGLTDMVLRHGSLIYFISSQTTRPCFNRFASNPINPKPSFDPFDLQPLARPPRRLKKEVKPAKTSPLSS